MEACAGGGIVAGCMWRMRMEKGNGRETREKGEEWRLNRGS